MDQVRVAQGRARLDGDTLITEPADPNKEGRRITLKMVRVE
jgi:hypothetical protein